MGYKQSFNCKSLMWYSSLICYFGWKHNTWSIVTSAVKVNNALTQIHFNGTHFFNARLTQRVFSVWPVAQPVVGEMEIKMHSVANLATLQTP